VVHLTCFPQWAHSCRDIRREARRTAQVHELSRGQRALEGTTTGFHRPARPIDWRQMRPQRCRLLALWSMAWVFLTTLPGPAASAVAATSKSVPPQSPETLQILTWMTPGYVSSYESNPIVLPGPPASSEAMAPAGQLVASSSPPSPMVWHKGSVAVSPHPGFSAWLLFQGSRVCPHSSLHQSICLSACLTP
jgi:hypothetical protein